MSSCRRLLFLAGTEDSPARAVHQEAVEGFLDGGQPGDDLVPQPLAVPQLGA